jgi:hypothetical protein
MTLIVTTFHRDPITNEYIDDPHPEEPGRDLAGFEGWRTDVWASPALVQRGARFLPQLAVGDVYVEYTDLAAFDRECQVLLQQIDAIAAELQQDAAAITFRLNNFRYAIQRAWVAQGGVYIG